MKKSTSYFGNRFTSALRVFNARRRSKVTILPAAAAAPEFEMLENRILLSGLTDGTKVLKKYNFVDADGDSVSIKVTGKVSKGAGFQVTDLGKGFDVDEINLVGLTEKNNLVITVTPKKLANSDKTTSNQIWTPGYTNIGSIVAEDQTNNKGRDVLGADSVRNIALNGAVVGSINTPDTDILGAIILGVGKTQFVDRINSSSPSVGNFDVGWNPSSGLINLYDVSANSIGKITVNGILATVPNNDALYPGYTPTNDIVGTISVTNDLGGIQGLRSTLTSNVIVGGNLGLIQVGNFQGNIDVGGDLTIQLPAGFNGVIAAGGHINLGFASGAAGMGTIIGGAGISGLLPSLVDPIFVAQGFGGNLINTSTSDLAGSGIADIRAAGTDVAFNVVSANSVGNVSAISFGTGMSVTAGAGGIGNVSSTAGNVDGFFISGGNIGNLSALGGELGGGFTATGAIGDLTVSTPIGQGITGTFTAGTSIGNVSATITTPTGGSAIDATFEAGTTIGTITVNSASTTDDDTVTGTINAGDGIGAIVINAATSGAALSAVFNADSNQDGIGDIASITVTSKGTGTGIASGVTTITGANIGDISVTMTNINSGAAITGTSFTATAKVEDGTGTGVFNNTGTIGNITVTSKGQEASGIASSNFSAGGAGSIGDISVTTAGSAAAISLVDFTAVAGPAGTEALQTSNIGTLSVTNTGTGLGLDRVGLTANDGVGTITVTTVGSGILELNVVADNDGDDVGDVGAISVTTSAVGSFGWANSEYSEATVSGANVGDITVNINSPQGSFGIAGINVEATAGDIGAVSVTNKSEAADAWGIGLSQFTATGIYDEETESYTSGGNIGQITVSTAGEDGGDYGSIGIYSSDFSAVGGSIAGIEVTTTQDDAIDTSSFYATENIGAIVVTSGDDGIEDTSFEAGGSIASITVTAQDDGIHQDSSFTATGDIGDITVVAGEDGIEYSTFSAANIGNISVAVDQVETGEDSADATGITGSSFTANGTYDEATETFVGGTIGDVTVTVSATTEDGNASATGIGIYNAEEYTGTTFSANQSIGAISVSATATSVSGDAFAYGVDNTFVSAVESIGAVSVSATATSDEGSAQADGVVYSTFAATGTYDIDSKADLGGTIGEVSVTAAATSTSGAASATGVEYSYGFLDANETIDAINITASATVQEGEGNAFASGVYNTTIAAGTTLAAITISATASADAEEGGAFARGLSDVLLDAGTGLTSLTVTASATADDAQSTGLQNVTVAGETVGNVDVTADTAIAAGDVNVSISGTKSIGNITANGNIEALDLTVDKDGTIGNITGTGKADQTFTATGGADSSIGNVSFTSLDNLSTVNVTLTGVETAGNITVDSPGQVGVIPNTADLVLAGNSLVTIGNINIDGSLSLADNLENATSIGALSAGRLTSTDGTRVIGAGEDSSIGLITIGIADAGDPTVEFYFDDYNGEDEESDVVVGTVADPSTNITTEDMVAGDPQTVGNLEFNFVTVV